MAIQSSWRAVAQSLQLGFIIPTDVFVLQNWLLSKRAFFKFAPVKFVSFNVAPRRFALRKSAPRRSDSVRLAVLKSALRKLASLKLAPRKFERLKSAPRKFAPNKSAPLKLALSKLASLRSHFSQIFISKNVSNADCLYPKACVTRDKNSREMRICDRMLRSMIWFRW